LAIRSARMACGERVHADNHPPIASHVIPVSLDPGCRSMRTGQ
jgi:hypothetical protein